MNKEQQPELTPEEILFNDTVPYKLREAGLSPENHQPKRWITVKMEEYANLARQQAAQELAKEILEIYNSDGFDEELLTLIVKKCREILNLTKNNL